MKSLEGLREVAERAREMDELAVAWREENNPEGAGSLAVGEDFWALLEQHRRIDRGFRETFTPERVCVLLAALQAAEQAMPLMPSGRRGFSPKSRHLFEEALARLDEA